MPWQPVIDGAVIPARPIDRIAGGAGANIDLMVGTNTDEWRLFLVPNGMVDQITEATVAGAVAPYGLPVDATLAGYRATLPNAKAGDILAAIMGDWYFRIPAMRLADALPFVFDTLGDGTELLLGMSPPQLLTDTMHAAWVAFASHGNCGWPTYDPETRATMRFDTKSELVEDSQRAIRALWGG